MSQRQRKSIRWKGWDYAQPGAYFVTVCTAGRAHLFGEIVEGEMRLNALGSIVEAQWLRTEALRPEVSLDEWVIMPNHMHAIVFVAESHRDTVLASGELDSPDRTRPEPSKRATSLQSPSRTLGAVMRAFKGAVTIEINALRATPGTPVWQRNFHDRVIRNEAALERIRIYIRENPAKWAQDAEDQTHNPP